MSDTLEKEVEETGKSLLDAARAIDPSFWETLWWERKVMRWTTGDEELKTGALRFLDVFPSLPSSREVARHLAQYLPDSASRLPQELRLGGTVAEAALKTPGMAALGARLVVTRIARNFIIGENLDELPGQVADLAAAGQSVTVDILGEAALSEEASDGYRDRYIEVAKTLAGAPGGLAGPGSVSIKLSALTPRFNPAAPQATSREVRGRLRPILRAAAEAKVGITIDMESYSYRDLTLTIVRDILEEEDFLDCTTLGVAMQAYLTDGEESLDQLIEWVKENNRRIGVRLVKGAYWEQEMVLANQRRWPSPVLANKNQTDAQFERMTQTLIDNAGHVDIAIASHNVRSLAHAITLAKKAGLPPDRFEVQTLFGMGEEITQALLANKIPVRVYAPLGELLPGMAYLVRRILENSSQESFLRHSFIEEWDEATLLAKPAPPVSEPEEAPPAPYDGGQVFVNEPSAPLHRATEQEAMEKAIGTVLGKLGGDYPILIDGKPAPASYKIISHNPARSGEVIGAVDAADANLATSAMEAASRAFGEWRHVSGRERSEILIRAADLIRQRKHELAAWQIFEVGKNWSEALADVDEAIDLINWYALAGRSLGELRSTAPLLGETNALRHVPRGPGLVVAPWNFPLAILAGLTCSALAAGNTVVVKPSSLSPVIGALFVDILHEAGLPLGVANYLPGPGGKVGQALIEHPATTFVNFTGSFDVGAGLIHKAGELYRSRDHYLKVVAEMGGKNAIIVDLSADLDEAVAGVVASGFGFGGQKCSACSRVIVHYQVYDAFVERLVPAVASLKVGDPVDPSVDYGPLIDEEAAAKAERYVAIGAKEATSLLLPEKENGPGHFVRPALFGDVEMTSPLAQEEIFGPVVSLMRAGSLQDGISMANAVSYALTAGLYSRTPSSVDYFIREIEAGNLYINRGITGAVVQRQPFGGHKRSGLGSAKAGGSDLVRELGLPQTVTENIVRHGFSPDIG